MDDQPLPLYGDGKNVRDWIYVLDNCAAIDFVLQKGQSGEIYNIGAGNEIQNIEITETILRKLRKPKTLIKPVADRPGHDRRYSLDCNKVHQLGWRPTHNFEEALDKTIEWYVSNVKWWRNIKEKQESFRQYYKEQYSTLK